MTTILKIGDTENPEVKNVIVTPELPNMINFVLMTNGNCLVSEQYAKKIGGHNRD